MNKYKELSKNTVLFTISSIGTKLITFFLVPLYTYVLTTEDYGTADLMSTTVSLLLPVLSLNIQDAVLRFSLDNETDSKMVISIASKIIALGSVLLGGLLLFLSFTHILKLEWYYLFFLWISYVSHALFNSFQMYLKACDRVSIIVISSLASTLVCCILNILLLLWIKLGVVGYLIAVASSSFVSALICFIHGKIYKDIHYSLLDNDLLQKMLVFCTPLILNSIAWWINSASDRYVLTFFQGTSANGIYSISYKIPTILSTLQTIFYNAWSVSAIKEFDKNDKDGFIGNIYKLYSCLSFLCCSIIIILNPYLSKLLYAKDFFDAWQYVPTLLIGTVFNGLSLFEGCLFTAVKKTKDVSTTTIIGAIVNTILNIIFIKYIGILGAAISTMIGYIIVWLLRTVKLRKHVIDMRVNWQVQITTMVIVLIQGVIASLLGTNWIQLVALLAIFLIHYKEIAGLFQFAKSKFTLITK